MKEKIKQIVNRIESGDLAYHDAETELLDLFAVSQQRELLKAFYAYVDDKWALGMLTDKVDEVIEGFEKSL